MKVAIIGAFDAKNSFSELLDRALHGDETVVTKHGKPIARIVPYEEDSEMSQEEVLASISKTRAQIASRGTILEDGESWKDAARKGLRL